jgi:predicted branched-subunit amino acid permease
VFGATESCCSPGTKGDVSLAKRLRSSEASGAIRAAVGVGVAVSAYGLSFGALSVAAGLDVWQTCVLSLLMFSGGSQFALVGIIASGGTSAGFAAIASAALLGTRNGLYAIRMAPIIGGSWPRKLLAAQWTIDESTAVSTAQSTPEGQRAGFWWTGAIIYVGWNLTTLAGAFIGDFLGDVSQYGLDAAAAAAFLGLLWPRLKQRQPVVVAAAAAVVAALITPVLPAGIPVLLAAVVAVVVGFFNLWGTRESDLVEAAPDPMGEQ